MTELTLDVYTSPMRDISTGGQFSPTTSTLLTGPTEAVLVDAQYMEGDVAELARRIESSGRTLTTIYITHAHADHYFGLEWLLDRFPTARAVALPAVVADRIEGGRHHLRRERARGYRIDQDGRCQLGGQMPGQMVDGCLGGRIGIVTQAGHRQAVDRADVDHPGGVVFGGSGIQQGAGQLGQHERRLDVKGEHLVPRGPRELVEGGAPGGAGIVDQDVQ